MLNARRTLAAGCFVALLLTGVAAAAPQTELRAGVAPSAAIVANWTGQADETLLTYYNQVSNVWHVHVYSTSCTYAALSSVGSVCTVIADAYFHVVPRTVSGHTVKTCESVNDVSGDNAYSEFYAFGFAYPFTSAGHGFLSPLYTDDQPLPVKVRSHFHFVTTSNVGGSGAGSVVEGHGVGLLACAKSSSLAMAGQAIGVA